MIDVETHSEVFGWVLERLAQAGLVKGKTLLVDGTTLEANAAMRSIVRRDTGEAYLDYLTGLAKAAGIRTPTRAVLARLDRRRAKKGSNKEWKSPSDPDAKITKMKDGRTHLAHKAEHAVDVESGAIVAVTVQDASIGDTGTIMDTLAEAEGQLVKLQRKAALETLVEGMQEVVADKGYHSDDVLVGLAGCGLAQLRLGARSREASLAGRRLGPARGVRQSPSRPRRARSAATAHAWRTSRTLLRTPVRNRPHAADALARSVEHPQAAADSRGCLQSRPAAASPGWDRDAEGLAGPLRLRSAPAAEPLSRPEAHAARAHAFTRATPRLALLGQPPVRHDSSERPFTTGC